ncbi:MAG: peptidyl-tRNA hydrolase Pth2 [Thermoplasmatota archaeon]
MGWKMVFVVRKDLELGKGKVAAQVAHAAVECTLKAQKKAQEALEGWLQSGALKAVLKVATEADLYPLQRAAQGAGLCTALIHDAGHTQVPANTVTVLGIGPGRDDVVDRVTGALALL